MANAHGSSVSPTIKKAVWHGDMTMPTAFLCFPQKAQQLKEESNGSKQYQPDLKNAFWSTSTNNTGAIDRPSLQRWHEELLDPWTLVTQFKLISDIARLLASETSKK